MRKISLDVDTLQVESFATEASENVQEGTVHAHGGSYPRWDCPFSWAGYGCDSVSGEYACICHPSIDGNTCFGSVCVDTWMDTCECIP